MISPRRIIILILLLFVTVAFLTLPRNPLLNDDASGYATATRNTIFFNQWLAPTLSLDDPSALLDKPPLGIWLLAWAPKFFGTNELTIHIPNVCYFTIILLIIYFSLLRFATKTLALNTTLITATSLCLVVYSRAPKLDVPAALCLLISHLLLYGYLKEEKPIYAYGVSLAAAGGFLIKSGLGVLPLVLTIIACAIIIPGIRIKIRNFIFSWHALFCLLIFLGLTGGVITGQYLAMKDQWVPYLRTIFIKSPNNPGYLGLGFHPSIIGLLLITIFPWTPLFLTNLKTSRTFSLSSFCALWFWPYFLFLIFCYKFTDYRTFTSFVPPMAILAGLKLESLLQPLPDARRVNIAIILWQIFFLLLFTVAFIALLIKPYNQDGISLVPALLPVGIFVLGLMFLTYFYWSPNMNKLTMSLAIIFLAYSLLFYNTRSIANAFNPDTGWPTLINNQRHSGKKFYIYRPHDRVRFMSPDLLYVDFMAGPADHYYWESSELKNALLKNKAIVLSDTASLKKLELKQVKIIAEDNYSSLITN